MNVSASSAVVLVVQLWLLLLVFLFKIEVVHRSGQVCVQWAEPDPLREQVSSARDPG